MVGLGFILFPLYVYPTSTTTWNPLVTAANSYPSVDFYAIVNPNNGPGGAACPASDYADAIATLNAVDNIHVLGYVHTAYEYTCNEICTCSAPYGELAANISTYQAWPSTCTAGSTGAALSVDGIFIDEAPTDSSCYTYMENATALVKSAATTSGSDTTLVFNPGAAVDSSYFGLADYINVFENDEAAYDTVDVGSIDGNGVYASQSTLIIWGYSSGTAKLSTDVTTILSQAQDGIAGLMVTDKGNYNEFPANWDAFVAHVASVVSSNGGS